MKEHRIVLIGKKDQVMNELFFKDFYELYSFLDKVYKDDLFYLEIELNHKLLTLEQYIGILKIPEEAKNLKIPEQIKSTEELEDWIQSWKTLEYVYEKYSYK